MILGPRLLDKVILGNQVLECSVVSKVLLHGWCFPVGGGSRGPLSFGSKLELT